MSEGFHGCTFTEEIFDTVFRLNLKHFDSDGCFTPKPFVNDAVTSFRNLAFNDKFTEIDFHGDVKSSGFDSHFAKEIFLLSFVNVGMRIFGGAFLFQLNFRY